jgi:predicted PurR-regulated permease PerM
MHKLYFTIILILFGAALAYTNHFLFGIFIIICICLLINIIVDAVSSIIENEKDIDL